MLWQIVRKTHRLVGTAFDSECIGNRRPDCAPREDIAVGDVEGLVARVGRLCCPGHRPCKQPGIGGLQNVGGAARIAEGLALCMSDRCIGADDRHEVHGHTQGVAKNQLWAKDCETETVSLRQFSQKVFLQPVKIFVRIASLIFACWNSYRMQMHAISLGALKQADMLQAVACSRQRGEQIAQHGQIGLHLVRLAPALDQSWFLEKGGIDDVSDLTDRGDGIGTGLRVGEIDTQVPCAMGLRAIGLPPRHADHPPIGQLREVLERRAPDDAGGASNQNGSLRHALLSLSDNHIVPRQTDRRDVTLEAHITRPAGPDSLASRSIYRPTNRRQARSCDQFRKRYLLRLQDSCWPAQRLPSRSRSVPSFP